MIAENTGRPLTAPRPAGARARIQARSAGMTREQWTVYHAVRLAFLDRPGVRIHTKAEGSWIWVVATGRADRVVRSAVFSIQGAACEFKAPRLARRMADEWHYDPRTTGIR